jgi:hypothetical protein
LKYVVCVAGLTFFVLSFVAVHPSALGAGIGCNPSFLPSCPQGPSFRPSTYFRIRWVFSILPIFVSHCDNGIHNGIVGMFRSLLLIRLTWSTFRLSILGYNLIRSYQAFRPPGWLLPLSLPLSLYMPAQCFCPRKHPTPCRKFWLRVTLYYKCLQNSHTPPTPLRT